MEERDRQAKKDQELLDKLAEDSRKAELSKAQEAAMEEDLAKAREYQERAAQVMTPILQPAKPRLEGTSYTEKHEAEITDLAAFVRAVAEGVIPLEMEIRVKGKTDTYHVLLPNQTVLNAKVKRYGKDLKWPGVTVKEKRNYRVTREDL